MARKAALVIGLAALWLGGWSAWQVIRNIGGVTRWADGAARVLVDIAASFAIGTLIGGLVMVSVAGGAFVADTMTPGTGSRVLRAGGVMAAGCAVVAGLLSMAARA